MKIESFELPLVVAQMEKIAGQTAALERSRRELRTYLQLRFGVDIESGDWQLDPQTGELCERKRD